MKTPCGTQPGAGRPPLYNDRMVRFGGQAPQEAIDFYRKLGGGNFQKGVRIAWMKLTGKGEIK